MTKLTYVFSVISKQPFRKKQLGTRSSEMFLIFRTTPIVVLCMAAAPLVATASYIIQSKSCFSMKWFNLAKMTWAVEQTPTLRQHNSTMVFASWLAKLQHTTSWTSSEIYIVFIELNTKQLSVLQLVKTLVQQIFWNMKESTVCLVVLHISGIFLSLETAFFSIETALSPLSTTTFWRCFKDCLWLILTNRRL